MSGSGVMSGSGGMSGSSSGEFSGISFVDHSAVDVTVELSGEQEVSGYRPFGSGFHSGFPSGFPSGVSGSGSASGDYSQHRGDVIYLTDIDMIEVTVPPLIRQPEQGRGVVEVSGEGSASGIHHDFSGTLDQGLHLSGSGDPHEKPTAELSVALPPGGQIIYTLDDDSLGQSGFGEESQEGRAGPSVYAVTPDTAYTNPTTAPSVLLETPAVVEQPEVVEGMCFTSLYIYIKAHCFYCHFAEKPKGVGCQYRHSILIYCHTFVQICCDVYVCVCSCAGLCRGLVGVHGQLLPSLCGERHLV